MSDQIVWNEGQIQQEYLKLSEFISNLKTIISDIEVLEFTNSNGSSASAIDAYKVAMIKHLDSRVAYMESLVLVLKAKGEEFNTVDKESAIIGGGCGTAPVHLAQ